MCNESFDIRTLMDFRKMNDTKDHPKTRIDGIIKCMEERKGYPPNPSSMADQLSSHTIVWAFVIELSDKLWLLGIKKTS